RRRHTRFSRDWSSDVCSSDLRPDPDRPGKWLYNLKGVELLLYRLAETITALREGRTLVITEGPKDADNVVRRLGLLATTNAMGRSEERRVGKESGMSGE